MSTSEVTRSLKVGRSPNQVTVEHEGENVVVRWDAQSCSVRTFNIHQMREIILLVDNLLTKYPEMWLLINPTSGGYNNSRFYLNLKDGKLTANNVHSRDNKRLTWSSLKKALEEIVGHVEGELGEHKTSSTQESSGSATKKGSR